ncbi:MAG: hypothetical protein ABSA12_17365 [Verrucomicrobiia bacterium]
MPIPNEAPGWLHICASQIGGAVVNEHAIEGIPRLKAQLESNCAEHGTTCGSSRWC